MAPEHVFILCAGLGTRMGEIGKVLPKLLWPVFEKKLLELQVDYARSLGGKKIFLNSHFLHEQILEFVQQKNWKDVYLVHEPELLDVGGGICNVAKLPELEGASELLVLNGDQFYLFPENFLSEARQELNSVKAVLFGIEVAPNSGYNQTVLKDGALVEIIKAGTQSENYLTYSGVSLINLKKLNPSSGPSKFFETVAPYKTEKILMKTPQESEYWDFGTTARYFDSLFKLFDFQINDKKSDFLKFCREANVFLEGKCFKEQCAYGQKRWKNTLSFSEGDILNYEACKTIFLGDDAGVSIEGNGIYYNGIYEPLP